MMYPRKRLRDISLALLAGAILIFTPPYVKIFDRPVFVFGVPLLHIYLFSLWLAGIVITGLLSRRIIADTAARDDNDNDTGGGAETADRDEGDQKDIPADGKER